MSLEERLVGLGAVLVDPNHPVWNVQPGEVATLYMYYNAITNTEQHQEATVVRDHKYPALLRDRYLGSVHTADGKLHMPDGRFYPATEQVRAARCCIKAALALCFPDLPKRLIRRGLA